MNADHKQDLWMRTMNTWGIEPGIAQSSRIGHLSASGGLQNRLGKASQRGTHTGSLNPNSASDSPTITSASCM